MTSSVYRGFLSAAYALWIVLFGVGLLWDGRAFLRLYHAVQHSQSMTQALLVQAQRTTDSARDIRERRRDTEFLQSLTTLLPQSKSFIRTQHAMSDEVESLRYKVGRRVK